MLLGPTVLFDGSWVMPSTRVQSWCKFLFIQPEFGTVLKLIFIGLYRWLSPSLCVERSSGRCDEYSNLLYPVCEGSRESPVHRFGNRHREKWVIPLVLLNALANYYLVYANSLLGSWVIYRDPISLKSNVLMNWQTQREAIPPRYEHSQFGRGKQTQRYWAF